MNNTASFLALNCSNVAQSTQVSSFFLFRTKECDAEWFLQIDLIFDCGKLRYNPCVERQAKEE
jgi:hypothetical protein